MQPSATKAMGTLDAESEEVQTVKEKYMTSPRKRRRLSDKITSKIANEHSGLQGADLLLNPDNQYTMEQGSSLITADGDDSPSQKKSAGDDREHLGVENSSERDKEVYSLIHKRALSMLNPARSKKFFWSEEADR